MPATNRRRATRHVTCVPVGVQTPEKERVGLIRDVSSEGALLFSKSQFKLNDAVKLSIRVDHEGTQSVEVSGRIVRVERKADGFWTFQMGVLFEPKREDLSTLFKALAERQERLFGTPG